jgi:Bacterial dnaA protein helix-turn-helix
MADLQGSSRREPINRVRQIAMHLARQLTGKSFIAIACQFGGRRHAGVYKAWRHIERLRMHDPELELELGELAARLREGAAASAPASSATELKRGTPELQRAGLSPPDG